jgi:hypothetical protein
VFARTISSILMVWYSCKADDMHLGIKAAIQAYLRVGISHCTG